MNTMFLDEIELFLRMLHGLARHHLGMSSNRLSSTAILI